MGEVESTAAAESIAALAVNYKGTGGFQEKEVASVVDSSRHRRRCAFEENVYLLDTYYRFYR